MTHHEKQVSSPWRGRLPWLGIISLLAILVLFQSNTADTAHYGRSCLTWLVGRWQQSSGLFSHGWLIPLISIGIAWWKRDELRAAAGAPSRQGLAVVFLSLLLHVIGYKTMLPRLNLLALIGLLWGIPFAVFGKKTARILLFPSVYLLFCLPLGFVDNWSFPLRMIATRISAMLLNGIGISCIRIGTAIHSDPSGLFSFDVADPCSGLRYLLAVTALAALYAYLAKGAAWKKWLLFLSAPFLAVIGNVIRITAIGVAARFFGQEVAVSIYHDASGYVVFSVVILLMLGLSALLNINYRKKLQQWKSISRKPASS